MMGIDEPVAVLPICRIRVAFCTTDVHKNLLCKCELEEDRDSWTALLMNMDYDGKEESQLGATITVY